MKKLVKLFWNQYDQMERAIRGLPKWRRYGIKCVTFLLSLYIMITRLVIYTTFPSTFLGVVFETMICFGFLIVFWQFLLIGVTHLLKRKAIIQLNRVQNPFDWPVFFKISVIIFVPLLIAFIAYFPGALDVDNLSQWWQVQNFEFDDWHPVTHSLIIWLITRVVNNISFVLFVQITLYSLSVAGLLHSLFSWGMSKTFVYLLAFLIGTNVIVMKLLMYPYKDCALMIVVNALMMILINIYLRKGNWLNSWYKVILFSLLSAFVILFRHNGLFFIIGAFVGLLMFKSKIRHLFFVIVLTFFITIGIKGPLYTSIGATQPNNTFEESVGVPMSILTAIYRSNPTSLDEDARAFFDDFTDEKNWSSYQYGNYNTIKWSTDNAEKLSHITPQTLLTWLLHAAKKDSYNTMKAFVSLTGFIWDSSGNQPLSLDVRIESNNYGYSYKNTWYNQLGKSFFTIFEFISNLRIPQVLLYCLGVLQLMILFATCYAFSRHGKNIWVLVLPSLFYNFGTLFLLSGFIPVAGTDHRYFVFNLVISLPIILVLLSDQRMEKSDQLDTENSNVEEMTQ